MISKYGEIFNELRKSILDGRYSGGKKFPSEMMICRQFKVSRITAVKVMDALERDDLIVRRRGCGTFVSPRARVRTGCIGLIVPSLAYGEIFPVISQGIVKEASEKGYSVILGAISSPDPKRRAEEARRCARSFIEQHAAGVIFQPLAFVDSSDMASGRILSELDANRIPTVLLDRCIVVESGIAHDFVGIDNFSAGRCLARHLLSEGARRILFVMRPKCASVIGDRFAGVAAAAGEMGWRVRQCVIDPQCRKAACTVVKGRLPDAIICESDCVAATLRATLQTAGVSIERIRFAGFDDVRYSQLMPSPYVSMRQPLDELAKTTFEVLMDRIVHPEKSTRKILLSASLSLH